MYFATGCGIMLSWRWDLHILTIENKGKNMQYKENDLIKLVDHDDKVFKVIMVSDSGNLMLVKHMTNELWSAHVEDVAEQAPQD